MMMASAIASQTDKSIQKCLDDWYVSNSDERNEQILKVIAENAEFPPTAVLVAIIEKKCGSYPKR